MIFGDRGIGKTWAVARTIVDVAEDTERLDGTEMAIVAADPGCVIDLIAKMSPSATVSRREVIRWPNGATARIVRPIEASFRGREFAFVAIDDVPEIVDVWDHVELACRRGRAQIMATGDTPAMFGCSYVVSHAKASDNPFLPDRLRDLVMGATG